ncbi:hypothetical protein [Halomonas mongoliensis]|uniref:hypothetical protein n=1 Tax=Halomonas mongoliensis TaxID=321265 RepID=UPI00403B1DE6
MSQNIKRIKRRRSKWTDEDRYHLVTKVDRSLEAFPDTPLDAICESCGVSQSNYRRWKDILDDHPEYHQEGIIPTQSRRPKRLARQTTEATKQRVIAEASKPHHTSANSITEKLKSEGVAIGKGTVIEILKEAGLYGTIHTMNTKGELQRKRGLLRLCEKRQQGPVEKR